MKPNPCASRFREKISFAVCEVLAARQGLAVYRLPRTRTNTNTRYAIVRADSPVSHTPLIYARLSGLWAALTVKGTK